MQLWCICDKAVRGCHWVVFLQLFEGVRGAVLPAQIPGDNMQFQGGFLCVRGGFWFYILKAEKNCLTAAHLGVK